MPVDLAVVPSGTVRDTYARGYITVEQVFNSFSLGIGAAALTGVGLFTPILMLLNAFAMLVLSLIHISRTGAAPVWT